MCLIVRLFGWFLCCVIWLIMFGRLVILCMVLVMVVICVVFSFRWFNMVFCMFLLVVLVMFLVLVVRMVLVCVFIVVVMLCSRVWWVLVFSMVIVGVVLW